MAPPSITDAYSVWADCPTCGASAETKQCAVYCPSTVGYTSIYCVACGLRLVDGQIRDGGELAPSIAERWIRDSIAIAGFEVPDDLVLVLPPEQRRWAVCVAPIDAVADIDPRQVSSVTIRFRSGAPR